MMSEDSIDDPNQHEVSSFAHQVTPGISQSSYNQQHPNCQNSITTMLHEQNSKLFDLEQQNIHPKITCSHEQIYYPNFHRHSTFQHKCAICDALKKESTYRTERTYDCGLRRRLNMSPNVNSWTDFGDKMFHSSNCYIYPSFNGRKSNYKPLGKFLLDCELDNLLCNEYLTGGSSYENLRSTVPGCSEEKFIHPGSPNYELQNTVSQRDSENLKSLQSPLKYHTNSGSAIYIQGEQQSNELKVPSRNKSFSLPGSPSYEFRNAVSRTDPEHFRCPSPQSPFVYHSKSRSAVDIQYGPQSDAIKVPCRNKSFSLPGSPSYELRHTVIPKDYGDFRSPSPHTPLKHQTKSGSAIDIQHEAQGRRSAHKVVSFESSPGETEIGLHKYPSTSSTPKLHKSRRSIGAPRYLGSLSPHSPLKHHTNSGSPMDIHQEAQRRQGAKELDIFESNSRAQELHKSESSPRTPKQLIISESSPGSPEIRSPQSIPGSPKIRSHQSILVSPKIRSPQSILGSPKIRRPQSSPGSPKIRSPQSILGSPKIRSPQSIQGSPKKRSPQSIPMLYQGLSLSPLAFNTSPDDSIAVFWYNCILKRLAYILFFLLLLLLSNYILFDCLSGCPKQ